MLTKWGHIWTILYNDWHLHCLTYEIIHRKDEPITISYKKTTQLRKYNLHTSCKDFDMDFLNKHKRN